VRYAFVYPSTRGYLDVKARPFASHKWAQSKQIVRAGLSSLELSVFSTQTLTLPLFGVNRNDSLRELVLFDISLELPCLRMQSAFDI
jgi:hypothetical protein